MRLSAQQRPVQQFVDGGQPACRSTSRTRRRLSSVDIERGSALSYSGRPPAGESERPPVL
jgi:hypothetical protein